MIATIGLGQVLRGVLEGLTHAAHRSIFAWRVYGTSGPVYPNRNCADCVELVTRERDETLIRCTHKSARLCSSDDAI